MKRLTGFIGTTIIGGLFVIVPAVLAALILAELVELLDAVAVPIVELLPVQELGGVEIATIVAWLLVLAVCFLAGLAARTTAGRRLGGWFERRLLARLPGYTAITGLFQRAARPDPNERLDPVQVRLADGTAVIGLVVEELDDHRLAVFVPSSPTPMMGAVRIVERDRATFLDVPVMSVLESAMHYGVGMNEIARAARDAARDGGE